MSAPYTSYNDSTHLLVFALECESQNEFTKYHMVHTGVGKVNAAYQLGRRLMEWRCYKWDLPKLVINLGSAGSTQFKVGQIINCTQFIERDMDVTALGCAPYATPFEDTPTPLAVGKRFDAFPEGICGSGDSFVTDGQTKPWNVIDMEAYALAKICHTEDIPFGCLKYITDDADGNAGVSWKDGLPKMAIALREAVELVIQ